MKVLVTGSQGFIGSYVCQELLKNGYDVVGIDDYRKYGEVFRPQDKHERFEFYGIDVTGEYFPRVVYQEKPGVIISGAAVIGGISLFTQLAYDLLAENERINAATFDVAIEGWKEGWLKKIIAMSSSMVFERTDEWPTPEDAIERCPPPLSTYGFSKLAVEYFCKGAQEQYGLPWVCVRPFNCVGVGEEESLLGEAVPSGNTKLMLSHVLPDFVNKCLSGQDPLEILGSGEQVRCLTNGKDIARGIRLAMENDAALFQTFNISSPDGVSMLELARMVWERINPDKEFRFQNVPGYCYDVQYRVPDVSKAERVLGFEAVVSLEESIDEVIAWMRSRKDRQTNPL